jgi:DNA-binding PadR family transcriptional regulator
MSLFHPRGRHGHHHDHGHGDHHAMKRLLAHGDLRVVVLLLIAEKPRHGYELIKLIESKSSGQYSPSPGVIYPTLTYLDDTGLITTTVQNEKKRYSITPEGKAHLDQNREHADSILKRLEELGAKIAQAKAHAESQNADPFATEEESEIRHVFRSIKVELKASHSASAKTKKNILKILERTLEQLRATS